MKKGSPEDYLIIVLHENYCWQVAPQQSLLPLCLIEQNSKQSQFKNQLFLTTLPVKIVLFVKSVGDRKLKPLV